VHTHSFFLGAKTSSYGSITKCKRDNSSSSEDDSDSESDSDSDSNSTSLLSSSDLSDSDSSEDESTSKCGHHSSKNVNLSFVHCSATYLIHLQSKRAKARREEAAQWKKKDKTSKCRKKSGDVNASWECVAHYVPAVG